MFALPLRLLSGRTTLLAIVALATISAPPVRADGPKEGGIFVTVKNPLTSIEVERIKKEIEKVRNQPNTKLTKVVFDFNPDDADSSTRVYGVCDDLARYIHDDLSLRNGIQCIAFVHKKVTGHTVLPVLACNDLVMADRAQIGDVVEQNDPLPAPEHIDFYKRLAGKYREALIMKMMDRNVEVVTGLENGSTIYVDSARVGQPGLFQGVTITDKKRPPVLPRGNVQLYDHDKALRFHLVTASANTRGEVEQQFNVQQLLVDPFGGEKPKACRIDLIGNINEAMIARLKDQFKEVRSRKENLIFFNFDCGGGDLSAAATAAEMILKLEREDKKPIHTVAYIPDRAPDLAVFLAFACNEIVMYRDKDLDKKLEVDPTQRYEAVLGDFEKFLAASAKGNDVGNTSRILKGQLLELATARGYSDVIVRGLLEPNEEILYVRNTAGMTKYMTDSELKLENDKAKKQEWTVIKTIKQRGKLLKLDATRAKEFHFIHSTVDNQDIREVYRIYGLEENEVRTSEPSWMDGMAKFLVRTEVVFLLVIVGFAGLILEIKMPGATLPGLIALVCFVLFFWSQAYTNGYIVFLAIGLFVAGIILLAIEIFLLPGFGVAGIGGIILILVGITLATLEKAPSSGEEWSNFGVQVLQYGLAIVASGVFAFVVGHYLPKIPYVNRIMLVPPSDNPDLDGDVSQIPGAAEAAALLGHVGVATSMLRPAGMAKFEDSYVDVVTEGDYIEPGTPIQVVEVEGNRIVVKRV